MLYDRLWEATATICKRVSVTDLKLLFIGSPTYYVDPSEPRFPECFNHSPNDENDLLSLHCLCKQCGLCCTPDFLL